MEENFRFVFERDNNEIIMEKSLKISILVANYNNGCYLQQAIDSVFIQHYKHWEIIIVDDNSTDNSIEVYDKYKDDEHFHIYYNYENRGVGYTKRSCLEQANGEICGFLDPDDVLFGEDVFDVMVETHLNHPNASMVYSGMYRADEKLNILRESPGKTIESVKSALDTMDWPYHPFLTFKMEKYKMTEGMDATMRRAVDYDLYYKLEEVGEVVHLDCIQYIQRNNPRSISLNDNAYKAAAWHTYACVQAMKRRGLMDESLMLFPFEHKLKEYYLKGYKKATSSRIYKTGKLVAAPLLLLQKLWKK